jgi:hypothetical protein
MTPTTTPHQFVPAEDLKQGDIIIFRGNVQETVRKTVPQRHGKILVTTDGHPLGIVANVLQSVAIVPR